MDRRRGDRKLKGEGGKEMARLENYVNEPEKILGLKDKEILGLSLAIRVEGETRVPEETLSNPVYTPTNKSVVCKPYREGRKRTSKGEKECRRVLQYFYGRTFHRVRPDFLRDRENLELDCFCPSLGIACEYHGKQHYVYPTRYCRRKKDFVAQLRRDLYKMAMCRKTGIYLIVVPYTVGIDQIEEYIGARLPKE